MVRSLHGVQRRESRAGGGGGAAKGRRVYAARTYPTLGGVSSELSLDK